MKRLSNIHKQLSLLCLTLLMLPSAFAESSPALVEHIGTLPDGPAITEADVLSAQKAWGDAVVKIGASGAKAPEVATRVAESSYAFEYGPILFKPTVAVEHPFRPDLESTLSYFVGGNPSYAEDYGFALTPWVNVRFDNANIVIFGNKAIAMGHYYFTPKSGGKDTVAEYTLGYVKTEDGRVLIFLQHSSVPYAKK